MTLASWNLWAFHALNASAAPDPSSIWIATALGEYAIVGAPLLLVTLWLTGLRRQREASVTAALIGLTSLFISAAISARWMHPRPFMLGVGHTLMFHVADSSFPSDHLTLTWSVAGGLLLFKITRPWGVLLGLLGLPMAWARIYLGVHFPLDMIGALMVSTGTTWVFARYPMPLTRRIYGLTWLCYQRLIRPLLRTVPLRT